MLSLVTCFIAILDYDLRTILSGCYYSMRIQVLLQINNLVSIVHVQELLLPMDIYLVHSLRWSCHVSGLLYCCGTSMGPETL